MMERARLLNQRSWICFVAVAILAIAGCSTTHNRTRLNTDGSVDKVMDPANAMRISETGEQQATFDGPGSQVWEDRDGVKANIGAPVAVVYFNADGTMHVVSPNDGEIKGLEYTPDPAPGEPRFKIASMIWNVSDPITAMLPILQAYVAATEGMTEDERAAWIAEIEGRADVTNNGLDLFKALLPAMVP